MACTQPQKRKTKTQQREVGFIADAVASNHACGQDSSSTSAMGRGGGEVGLALVREGQEPLNCKIRPDEAILDELSAKCPEWSEPGMRQFTKRTLAFRDLKTTSQLSSRTTNELVFTNSQSNQHKHSKRDAKSSLTKQPKSVHRRESISLGLMRTLEVESHCVEVAAQREGFEQTRDYFQTSLNASNEEYRMYNNLYEAYQDERSLCESRRSASTRARKTVELRSLGSYVPRGGIRRSQTEARKRNC